MALIVSDLYTTQCAGPAASALLGGRAGRTCTTAALGPAGDARVQMLRRDGLIQPSPDRAARQSIPGR